MKKQASNSYSEQIIIGNIMAGRDVSLNSEVFFDTRFKFLYELSKKIRTPDMMSMAVELEKLKRVDLVPLVAEISDHYIPGSTELEMAIDEVERCFKLRNIAEIASKLYHECTNGEDNTEFLLSKAERILYSTFSDARSGYVKVNSVADQVFADIADIASGKKKFWGIPTGFVDLDNIIGGMIPKDLIILGGRPSMGKTALAMNIAENVTAGGGAVGVQSLEMSKEGLTTRLISGMAGVDSYRIMRGNIRDSDWPKLTVVKERLSQMDLHIDDSSGLHPSEIRSRARRLKAKHDIKLLILDYLQLTGGKSRSREEEISMASREMKATAKELNIPVLALCQLNRSCENRPDKRPMLSDLRESGAIEQDADVVMFSYRDEYYNT